MSAADAVLATLRAEVIDIVTGTVFLSIGLAACVVAIIRGRRGVRILVWWGIWSGTFGLQTLIQTPAILAALPAALKPTVPYMSITVTYLLLVAALLAWRELTLGKVRFFLQWIIFAALAIAVGGIGTFLLTGSMGKWKFGNDLLAALLTIVLVAIVLVPKIASRFLAIPNHRVLAAGTVIFASEAFYTSLSGILHYRVVPIVAPVGFAALLFSLGYVALQMTFSNERRLLSIETELETAGQIQTSILPTSLPELVHLRISASYLPMTAVAGDFYQFLQPDANHLGILIADVSGHGIPAALIASMIKVAMQAVAGCAHDPAQVLAGLNRILSSQASGQLASAAYLWLDLETHLALYSAAGHPPLLYGPNAGAEMQRIESNGLLFGIKPDCEYPVRSVPVEPSTCFLLYTDGVTETENAAGEAFGDRQLERVVRENRQQPASGLSERILAELRKWRPAAASPQDDITLIVVDVV